MNIAVWDTYVEREDGAIMHFDILVPDTLKEVEQVLSYGRSYLEKKPFKTEGLTTKECRWCHIEKATVQTVQKIQQKGYDIIEMEFCD